MNANTNKTYNGWTNYETWNVALWLGNDQGSQNYWSEAAQECYDNAEEEHSFTRVERATLDLSDRLKSEMEEANPVADQASMWADLMGAALSEVNWYEIAEHYIEDVEKDEGEESEENNES